LLSLRNDRILSRDNPDYFLGSFAVTLHVELTHAISLLSAASAAEDFGRGSSDPEIVVEGKRVTADEAPMRVVHSSELNATVADTIGEVIGSVQRTIPGQNAAIIVNGQRLGSLADVNSLPVEAIERIEILPSSAGVRRGMGGSAPIVNVVLKGHFRSLTATAEARNPTDGGADRQQVQLNAVSIRGDGRVNLTVSGRSQSDLSYYERFAPAVLEAMPDAPNPNASLMPGSTTLSLLAGKAIKLGRSQAVFSISGTLAKDARKLATRADNQSSDTLNADGSATFSGSLGTHFWTVIGKASFTRTLYDANKTRLNLEQSRSKTGSLAVNFAGPVLQVPGGTLTYYANAEFGLFSLSESQNDKIHSSSSRQLASGQFGLEIPLLQRGSTRLSVGDFAMRLQGQVNRSSGSETVAGYETAIKWSPISGISFELISAHQALALFGDFTSAIVFPDTLLFDPVRERNVRVRQVTGSNPNLDAPNQNQTSLRVSFGKTNSAGSYGISAYYTIEKTNNPIFTPSPSLPIEQAFPQRFIRDSSGNLIEIDTRQINAFRQQRRSLNISLNASGSFAQWPNRKSPPQRAGDPTTWTVNINFSSPLSEYLQLTENSSPINVLDAQIGTSGGSGSRFQVGSQAGLGNSLFGAQWSLDWSSGTKITGQGIGSIGSYRPPVRIGLDLQLRLAGLFRQSEKVGRSKLALSVDNFLNSRPQVRFPDRQTPLSLNPKNLDPIGRTIKLSFRTILH
jgi:hypothetical protein